MSDRLPIIDVSPLLNGDPRGSRAAAREIAHACRDLGFFYAVGHGLPSSLFQDLEKQSHRFFALPETSKQTIAMARGGRAWRGYFPVGGELTSGRPDLKEGLYFGEELGPFDWRVASGLALHGANLFPEDVPELKPLVLAFLRQATLAGQAIMDGVALSLGLESDYFRKAYTAQPTLLFRIFHNPPTAPGDDRWGVGEHTDYGLLTLLAQDQLGGLEVKTPQGWILAPPIEGALICNLGDMLDRLTGGWYRSTPHRVRNLSGKGRLSFPFFFDPAFAAKIQPLSNRLRQGLSDTSERWDGANLDAFGGTYGDYLLAKVAKVFPDLARTIG